MNVYVRVKRKKKLKSIRGIKRDFKETFRGIKRDFKEDFFLSSSLVAKAHIIMQCPYQLSLSSRGRL